MIPKGLNQWPQRADGIQDPTEVFQTELDHISIDC